MREVTWEAEKETIEQAEDYKREVTNQKQELRVILESIGITVDNLKIV